VKAPSNVFKKNTVGQTVVTKTIGTKVAKDSLLGRVFEVSLGDLKDDSEDEAFRKFSLKVDEVSGSQCLTSFHGMDMTTDKLRSLVRKWQSLIETHVDIKTTDGYGLRVFVIGFTKRRPNQKRKTSYAQSAQMRQIRKKMVDIVTREAAVELKSFVDKLQVETIGKAVESACQSIYPLQNVYVRKVKVLRAPKVDMATLLAAHGGSDAIAASDKGVRVARKL